MSKPLKYTNHGPELLLDLVEKVSHVLQTRGGFAPERAEELAMLATDQMAQTWGGRMVYFPKGTYGHELRCFQMVDRDWEIFRMYNGANRDEVCQRFEISPQRLYQIIFLCRQKKAALRATG